MDKNNHKEILNLIKKNIALADMGAAYAHNPFDKERYEELKGINTKLLSLISDKSLESIVDFYAPVKEYITPKIEIRGLLLNERNEILMVKEKLDPGKWAIPGGWADIGFSPSEVIIKEMKEETGLNVRVKRVLAVFDKNCHDHPKDIYYTYTIVFLCEKIDGELETTFDIEDVKYFNITNLPPLSEYRILESQLRTLYFLAVDKLQNVYFD